VAYHNVKSRDILKALNAEPFLTKKIPTSVFRLLEKDASKKVCEECAVDITRRKEPRMPIKN